MFKRKNKRPPRLEVQVITVIGLVLAALCIVSAYSPTVEATLNLWIGVPVVALTVLGVLVALARELWAWVKDMWEE